MGGTEAQCGVTVEFTETADATQLQLGKLLGCGAFANVYRGVFKGQVCAVKVLKAPAGDKANTSQSAMAMFALEAQTLLRRPHRHIPKCLAHILLPPNFPGLQPGYVCPIWAIVLEICEEGTLAQLMHKQLLTPWRPLYDEGQAFAWSLQVAEALSHLHTPHHDDSTNGENVHIIHRDLKLDNVLLKREAGRGRRASRLVAKLADLGLQARVTTPVTPTDSLLKTAIQSHQADDGVRAASAAGSLPAGTSFTLGTAHSSSDVPTQLESSSRSQSNSLQQQLPCKHNSDVGILSAISTDATHQPTHQWRRNSSIHMTAGTISPRNSHASCGASALASSSVPHAALLARNSACSCPLPPNDTSSSCGVQLAMGLPCRPLSATSGVMLALARSNSQSNIHSRLLNAQEGTMDMMAARMSHLSLDVPAASPEKQQRRQRRHQQQQHQHNHQQLTGQTGSCTYMAPEVFLSQPYSEKADVHSLGMLLYEIFGRTMLAVSHVGCRVPGLRRVLSSVEEFAAEVARCYRPPRLDCIPQPVWDIITACWAPDMHSRPDMAEVVTRLKAARAACLTRAIPAGAAFDDDDEGSEAGADSDGAGSVVGIRRSHTQQPGCQCVIC